MAGVVKVEEDCTSMDRNLLTKAAEKVIFFRLLKNGQCKAPEILRVASRRIRSDILPRRRVGESARGVLGSTPQRLALLDESLMGFVVI